MLNMSTCATVYIIHKSIMRILCISESLPNPITLITFEHLIKGLKVLKRIKTASGPYLDILRTYKVCLLNIKGEIK